MKNIFKIALVLSAVLALGQSALTVPAPQFPSSKHIRYAVQAGVQNPVRVRQLSQWLEHNNFDVAGTNWREGYVEVITGQEGIQFLNSKGLHGVELKTLETMGMRGPDSRYLNPNTAAEKMKAVASTYANLTKLVQIGTSLQGRPILALFISETPNPDDPKNLLKPSIIFDAEHHAREIMTPEIVMDVADVMLKSYNTSRTAHEILHNWNIWLVPMVNPDGSNIVFTKDNMWRKNARGNTGSTFGVDINRNYTYRWNGCNGSSGSQGAQDYHGSAAGSEPETQALMNLANKVRPTASLSYHSYSEFVLYPLGCNGAFTSDKNMVVKIAGELAAKLPSDSGRGNYTPGTPWQLLYDVDGDSMDYMYAAFGTLAYTFEINQDFQPPYTMRDPTVAKHRNAWTYFLARINQNLLTVTVVNSKTGQPEEALIDINTLQHQQGELPFKTNVAGRYFKVLDPGQYLISAKLKDGRAGQVQVNMSGAPQQVTLTIP